MTSGKRYWSDGTPVAGQQFEYAFDDIGNRTATKAGGDSLGGSLRSATYGANTLNQYTNRTVSGTFDVLGIAHAAATTTVNSASTYRKGEYFHKAVSVDNSTGAVYQAVTVQASATNGTDTSSGNVFLPKAAEVFTYDADGNLTSDGRWTNRWDAENRLVEMQALSSIPSGAKKDVKFIYDSEGRRISKTVSNWTGSAWALSYDNRFLYDAWNLIAEVTATNGATVCSYIWGVDLSGSLQGAGGVGGLLAVSPAGNGTHFVGFDGNGNVAGLIGGSTGTNSAQFEYGPFGETTRTSGNMAAMTLLRFSTKYSDVESDLFHYGFRIHSPTAGRWLARDPLGEKASADLYAFVRNDPNNRFDVDGRREPADKDPARGSPRNYSCSGKCGKAIDGWLIAEIQAQKKGWVAWTTENPRKNILVDYFRWALANQYYKGGQQFTFNGPMSGCGTRASASAPGCGFTVTVCGNCVHTSTLGNIMFGLIGAFAGFSQDQLDYATTIKRLTLNTIDPYDEKAYKLGLDLYAKLAISPSVDSLCSAFNQALTANPAALRVGNETGGNNDYSSCGPCSQKTAETQHGGNSQPAGHYY